MRLLVLLLFPCLAMAQPRKASIYARQAGFPLSDSLNTWLQEEPFQGVVLIGEHILNINNLQYSVDAAQVVRQQDGTVYVYQISLKKKKYTCLVYPSGEKGEWELYLISGPSLMLYRLKE